MRREEKDKSLLQISKKKMSRRAFKNSKKDCLPIFISRINTKPDISKEIKVQRLKCSLKMTPSLKKATKKTKWMCKSLLILLRTRKSRKCLCRIQIWSSAEKVNLKSWAKHNRNRSNQFIASKSCPKKMWICIKLWKIWIPIFFLRMFLKTNLKKISAL